VVRHNIQQTALLWVSFASIDQTLPIPHAPRQCTSLPLLSACLKAKDLLKTLTMSPSGKYLFIEKFVGRDPLAEEIEPIETLENSRSL